MTRWRTSILVCVALGGALACRQATDAAERESPQQPSEPAVKYPAPEVVGPSRVETIGEHQLEVHVEAERGRFMVSEPVFIEIVFEADGPLEIEMAWMGRNGLGRPENYRVQLRDAQGRALAVPDSGPNMGGQSWVAKLGEEPSRQRLFLPNWFETLAPGPHVVVVETTFGVRTGADEPWQPLALALELDVEVVADDPRALGELIDALASTAGGDDGEAAREAMQQLAAIDDPRTLDHWIALATYPDYTRRFGAIQALGASADPRAAAALIRASETQAAELPADRYTTAELRESSAGMLRLAAVQMLAELPDRAALDAVLRRADDPDESVRLTVVQRAAKLDEDRARPLLRKFSTDSSEMVRGEAERFLRALGD